MYTKIWDIQTSRLKGDLERTTPLTRLRLRLTLRCNLKCKFCIQRTFKPEEIIPEKELGKKELLKIINEAYDLGVRFIEISGNGEPLCKEGIIDIMEAIRKKSIFGELTTNGTLFNHEDIKRVVNMNWDLIRFSIDGSCEKTNDRLRGVNGAFQLTKKNMELLKEVKKNNGSEKPQIAINFIVTNQNYKEIPDVLNLLNEVGGKKLWITPMILQNESAKSLMLNEVEEEKFKGILKETDRLAKEHIIETNANQFIKETTKQTKEIINLPTCFMPWSDIAIGEEGQVGPCFAFYFDTLNIKNKSLEYVWKSREFSDLRKKLLNGDIPKNCNCCKQWWGPEEAKQIHRVIKNARREN